MVAFLQKSWFLAVLLAGGLILWLRPTWMAWTRSLDVRYVVAPALFLAAWSLDSHSLYQSIRRPFPALWSVAISYLALPALGWLTGRLLSSPDEQVGLMLIVSAPCTLASAVLWTRMGGGNEATAMLATMLTTCISWIATSTWLVLGTGTQVEMEFSGIMTSILFILVLPVAVGQVLRSFAVIARAAQRHRVAMGFISRLLILVVMLKAAYDVMDRLSRQSEPLQPSALALTAVICLGLHVVALAGGFWSSSMLGIDRPNQIAVAFSCSQKTLPVSLYLFDTYFMNYPLAIVPMVFYHMGQLVLDTFIAEGFVHRARKQLPA